MLFGLFLDQNGYAEKDSKSEKHKYGYELKENKHFHHTTTEEVSWIYNIYLFLYTFASSYLKQTINIPFSVIFSQVTEAFKKLKFDFFTFGFSV